MQKSDLFSVLNREEPAGIVYAPNYWQWFAHHLHHKTLPDEIEAQILGEIIGSSDFILAHAPFSTSREMFGTFPLSMSGCRMFQESPSIAKRITFGRL